MYVCHGIRPNFCPTDRENSVFMGMFEAAVTPLVTIIAVYTRNF
jgi:hypothetical protein